MWRDIKVVGDYAYIVSEATDHGIQVFDLKRLLSIDASRPVTFDIPGDLTALVDIGTAHNVIANEELDRIYVCGMRKPGGMVYGECGGGLWMFDVKDPSQPKDLGCVYDEDYVHDAQCVVYRGPDERYRHHDICFTYGGKHFRVIDVTDAAKPVVLSSTTYDGAEFTHQGWATEDMTHILLDDEKDEMLNGQENHSGPAQDGRALTRIINVEDLEHPVFTSIWRSAVVSVDHNQYVNGNLSFQSNYGAGLRILDISRIKEGRVGDMAAFEEVGYFDCYPSENDAGEIIGSGAWSAFPWFESGNVVVNCIERGVFSLRYTGGASQYSDERVA
jgi:choice-of-anchor B domain-containing protein